MKDDSAASGRVDDASPSVPYRFLAVRSGSCFAILPLDTITRIEAQDNHVRIVAGRTFVHRDTLARVHERLRADGFVRVHRCHVVNAHAVRELRPRTHGEYEIVLADATSVASGRAFRGEIERAFGLRSA